MNTELHKTIRTLRRHEAMMNSGLNSKARYLTLGYEHYLSDSYATVSNAKLLEQINAGNQAQRALATSADLSDEERTKMNEIFETGCAANRENCLRKSGFLQFIRKVYSLTDDEIKEALERVKKLHAHHQADDEKGYFSDINTVKDALDYHLCIRFRDKYFDLETLAEIVKSFRYNSSLAKELDVTSDDLIDILNKKRGSDMNKFNDYGFEKEDYKACFKLKKDGSFTLYVYKDNEKVFCESGFLSGCNFEDEAEKTIDTLIASCEAAKWAMGE